MGVGLRTIGTIEDVTSATKFKQHIAIPRQSCGQGSRYVISAPGHNRGTCSQPGLRRNLSTDSPDNVGGLPDRRQDSEVYASMLQVGYVPPALPDIIEPALNGPIFFQ